MARGRLGGIAAGIVILLVTVLVLGLGGGDSTKPLAGVDLADAANKTIRAGGAEVEMEVELILHGHGSITTRGRGLSDASGHHMLLDMDLSEMADAIPDASKLSKDELQVHYAYADPVMYMRWPAVAKTVDDDKSWIKVDFGKVLGQAGVDASLFDAENTNPGKQLQFLRAAGGKVDRLGTAKIRGKRTTHYRGKIDIRRYPQMLPPAERPKARQSVERLIEKVGNPVDDVDVWVGDDGLVRRMRTSWDTSVDGGRMTRVETIDYIAFGKRFTVKPPPAGETVDATAQMSKAFNEGG